MANVISDIYLCRVAITPVNQIDFISESEQSEYFANMVVKTINNCSYQARTAVIKVNGYVDDEWLQLVNYGYYVNKYQGVEKKFYFWIAQKNYGAKGVTELVITIDVFQTWQFYFSFQPCMVERKHVVNDDIGLYTHPEGFELGEYVSHNRVEVEYMKGDVFYCMALTPKDSAQGHIFGKQFSAFEYKIYDQTNYETLGNDIKAIVDAGQGDSIAYIFTVPKAFFTYFSDGVTVTGDEGITRKVVNYNWADAVKDFNFNGYNWTPFNNKLYTYPYNFITIKDNKGSNVVLKWELFNITQNTQFFIDSVFTHNPTFTITPTNYCNRGLSIEDSLQTNGYGLCSWNNDNYASWYAQHQNSLVAQSANAIASYNANNQVQNNDYSNALDNRDTSMYKGVINTGAGVVGNLIGGNITGAVTNGISGGANTYLDYQQSGRNADNSWVNSNILNKNNYQNTIRTVMASIKDAQVQPNTAKGDTSSTGLDLARDTVTFFIEQTTIKPEYAQKIDLYFQMFGYQVNILEVPQLRTRQRWNYLKTINATITHIEKILPFEDIRMLEEMFNNGLTIWHKQEYMYNYSIANPVIV